ncbi:MAG: 4-demethylwyosine synthase TYW1 [Nanoarchaeota archaeon]|nr:4-demethylwyosine synthase TYW1 [Nanoarchaeota archaeon]MBU4116722.1 4-demethylwyosine synthase TYW1 [Nanoarchaeota archaeon]
MIPEKIKKILRKQHYEIVGNHSAVQTCRWTKKSLRNEGVCYKEQFYGIKSHLCCQMTSSLWCPNKCVHCWRAIEFTTGEKIPGKIDSPKKIIDECIKAQRKLLQGFKIDKKSKKKQLSKANQEKYGEAQEPMQFAISLSGEPTIYPLIGDLIEELRKRGKTSFLVTNGLYPEKIKEISEKNQLPTQLYVSVNTSNKKLYDKFHRSCKKNAWEKLNQTLELLKGLTCRTVFRMNLVRELNMDDKHIKEYAELIKKAGSDFIEVKGYMSVGFARERLGYDKMPTHEEMKGFSEKLVKELNNLGVQIKILDEKIESRVLVLGKNKKGLKIKEI